MNSYMVIATSEGERNLCKIGDIEFQSGLIGDLYILETNKTIDQVKDIDGVLEVTEC